MKFILSVFAVSACIVMAYTFSLGWRYHSAHLRLDEKQSTGALIEPSEEEAIGHLMPKHFVWGMLTGIVVSFTHSLVLTYFLGTGKAIKEQTEIRGWEPEEYAAWKKLMARSVIPSALGILLIIVAAFSGGFTMIQKLSPDAHLLIAATGIVAQVPIYLWEIAIIKENGKIMDRIVERLGENVKLTL